MTKDELYDEHIDEVKLEDIKKLAKDKTKLEV